MRPQKILCSWIFSAAAAEKNAEAPFHGTSLDSERAQTLANPMAIQRIIPLMILIAYLHINLTVSGAPSFGRPGKLNVSQSYSSPTGVQLTHNDSLKHTLLTAPNNASEFVLLLQKYQQKPVCSAALMNATSYLLWMEPCPPLTYSNCSLVFTNSGSLDLSVNGTLQWTTNTTAKGVRAIRLSNDSNVQIVNRSNQIVWNTAAHPTSPRCLESFQTLISTPALAETKPPATSHHDSSSSSLHASMAVALLLTVGYCSLLLHCVH
eukprot:Gb_31612 [translate_table: standard]